MNTVLAAPDIVAKSRKRSNRRHSITGLAYGTLYFIFHDDPDLLGGTVSYQYSTVKTDALNHAGRFFDGSILTPVAGGADTIGNNDGGAGAQTGYAFNLYASSLAGSSGGVSNPTYAYDGNTSTAATLTAAGGVAADLYVSGFGHPGITPSSAKLYVKTSATTGASGTATLQYSLDGGNTWTTIRSILGSSSWSTTTDSVTLSNTQNMSLVQVRLDIAPGSVSSSGSFYEAWIAVSQ